MKKIAGNFITVVAGIFVFVIAVLAYQSSGLSGSLRLLSIVLLPIVALTLIVIGGRAAREAIATYIALMDDRTLKVSSVAAQSIYFVGLIALALLATYIEVSAAVYVGFVVFIISFIGLDKELQYEKRRRKQNAE